VALAKAQKADRALSAWPRQAWVVVQKDLAIELNTGEVVTTSCFFALLVVILGSLAFYGGPATRHLLGPGVIWISITFAAVLAVGRAWQREREEGALDALLVAPLSRSAIFAGKAAGLMLFLVLVELVVIPLTAVLFAFDFSTFGLGLATVAALATPGIAASGSLFGAMTVRTRARDLMLAIVMFPLLSPTLLAAVAASRELLGGATLGELTDYLKLMGLFDVVFWAGGLVLFGILMDD
jgi:heme exporter protein B